MKAWQFFRVLSINITSDKYILILRTTQNFMPLGRDDKEELHYSSGNNDYARLDDVNDAVYTALREHGRRSNFL